MVDWRQQAREDAIQEVLPDVSAIQSEVISDDDDDDDEEDHTPTTTFCHTSFAKSR